MNKNEFEKHELYRYIYTSQRTVSEVMTGLKFALLPNVTSKMLNKQNLKWEIDEKGITNIVINPVQYPNTQEVIKIPNFRQWVDKNLTDSVTSFRKFFVPSNYDDQYSGETSISDGLIINPSAKIVNKIGIRGNNVVLNFKAKDEVATDFNMVIEGENNESTFLTIPSEKRFHVNYDMISDNLLVADRTLNFKTKNEYHSNYKTYQSFKGDVPIVELDGGMLSLPYGVTFSSRDEQHYIRKEYNDVVHRSKRGILFYFGQNYFNDNIFKNSIKFNDSSIDINGRQNIILNYSNGYPRVRPLLRGFELTDSVIFDNIFTDNRFYGINYFQSLRWYGNTSEELILGNQDSPFITLKSNEKEFSINRSGFDVKSYGESLISLRTSGARVFGAYFTDVNTYFTTSSYFTKPTFINANLYVENTESIFKGKVNIENDLIIKRTLFCDNSGYFGGGLLVDKDIVGLGYGYFKTGLYNIDGEVRLNSSGGTIDDPDTVITSDSVQISNKTAVINSSTSMDINVGETLTINSVTLNLNTDVIDIGANVIKMSSDKLNFATSGNYKFVLIDDEGEIVSGTTNVLIGVS